MELQAPAAARQHRQAADDCLQASRFPTFANRAPAVCAAAAARPATADAQHWARERLRCRRGVAGLGTVCVATQVTEHAAVSAQVAMPVTQSVVAVTQSAVATVAPAEQGAMAAPLSVAATLRASPTERLPLRRQQPRHGGIAAASTATLGLLPWPLPLPPLTYLAQLGAVAAR
eukprot:229477-Chlamydomonas_euryale.AAC.1